jgi:hypothetical protein
VGGVEDGGGIGGVGVVTAPAVVGPVTSQDPLMQLLNLSDVSRARTAAIENQADTEIDRVYAQHLSDYTARTSPAEQSSSEEDEIHPLLTTALLIAVTAVLQRAFASGAAEGRRFADQQLGVFGRSVKSDTIFSLDDDFMSQVVKDFVDGQKTLARSGGVEPAELVMGLAGRAKLAAGTAIEAGRNRATENELKHATEGWTGEVHKLWTARFDLETVPCPLCVRLHGVHVPLDDSFPERPGEPAPYQGEIARPPRHPNCRCSILLYLPAKMGKNNLGPTPLSMIQYADQVLSLMGSDAGFEFVEATVVWVKPYTRLQKGHLNFVKGYYFNIDTGRKVPHHNNRNTGGGGGGVPTVSVGAIHTLSPSKLHGKSVTKGGGGSGKATSGHGWTPGSYHISLPDGSHAGLDVHPDGSGVATHLDNSENVDSSGVGKYLDYWHGLGQVTPLKSDPQDPTIGKRSGDSISQPKSELLVGQKTFARDHVAQAIKLLNGENSTSVKAPLKSAGNPLAGEDLKSVAETHAGKSLHYSKLKQGVVDALQHHLDQHDSNNSASGGARSASSGVPDGGGVSPTNSSDIPSMTDEQLAGALGSAHTAFAQIRTNGTATSSPEFKSARDSVKALEAETASREQAVRGDAVSIPDAPTPPRSAALPVGAVAPAALPRQELTAWNGILTSAKSAFKVSPAPGDRGSALAAGLQKVASTRHRYYVQVSDNKSTVSMKMNDLVPGSTDQNYMIHSNGSVWDRSLDVNGAERLTPVSVARAKQLTDPHFSSVDGISLDKALSGVRALNDQHLDTFMQHALVSGNMDAFDKLSAEADRRDVTSKRKRADDEKRAAQFEKLLAAGGQEESAVEQVYGVTPDAQRRRSAIAALRANGYTGVNLTELGRKAYKDYIYQLYLQAELAMHGHMLTKDGEAKEMSPLSLFSGPESRVLKYASPELKDWFELHGRLTFKDWINNYLGKFNSAHL